jgi:hypothetical protein
VSTRYFTKDEAEELLESSSDVHELLEVLWRLPLDVDPRLTAKGALRLFEPQRRSSYFFARGTLNLPADVIPLVIKGLKKHRTHASALYVVEAMRDSDRADDWNEALSALLDMQRDNFTWGSKERRGWIQAVAQNPRLLRAVQAAVVGSAEPQRDMLGVLAADGSEASMDALLPHFARAERDATSLLETLKKLETHAKKTPAFDAMLASVQRRLATRNEKSPCLKLARSLGFEGERFRGRIALWSTNSRYEGMVTLDSKKAKWLSVFLRNPTGPVVTDFLRRPTTEFDNEGLRSDDLKLGACELAELPAWLARAEKKLKVRWRTDPAVLDLRKADAARITEWLFSAVRKKPGAASARRGLAG